MKTYKLMALFSAMTLFQSLSAQSNEDHYVGTFSNTQSGLVLSMGKNTDGTYQGFLQVQGQQYPFSGGVKLLGMINAEYQYNGQPFAFSLSRLLGEYYVTSEGVSIPVKKTANEPLNAGKSPATTGGASTKSTAPTTSTSTATPGAKASTSTTAATGSRLADPYSGFAFNCPSGWTGKSESGGFVLSKPGSQITMIVSPHTYGSVAEMREQIIDVNDASSQTHLSAKTQSYGTNGLLSRFDGTAQGNPWVIEIISLLSPHGGGIVITATGAKGNYTSEYTTLLKSIANSVQFSKAQTSGVAEQWKQKIRGKRLDYYYTNNGLADHFIIHLCTNGTFVFKNDTSYSSNNAYSDFSYADAGNNGGSWQVLPRGAQAALVLRYSDGRVVEYTLSPGKASNEILLNSKRYFVQAGTMCN